MENSKYGHLIVRNLQYEPPMTPDFKEIYKKFAQRVLWIDDAIVPGAFQMNISWYKDVPQLDPIFAEHAHHSAEIIGFFGSDPDSPYDLHGRIEIIIEDETHVIDSSSLIFIPPDVPHTLRVLEVNRPIFHFSAVTEGQYNGSAYQ